MPQRSIRLNGKKVTAEYGHVPGQGGAPEASEQLLYWLRERHGQRGAKFGCGVSQCGACTVLVDGEPVRSCVRQLHTVADGADVRTLDGRARPIRCRPRSWTIRPRSARSASTAS